MKVTLETYGGLAAVGDLRRRPQVLDTDTLPEDTAAELVRLVTAAVATPDTDRAEPARDAMSYTVTVQDDGRVTVLEQSDAAMTPAFAALLALLRKHLAQQ